MERFKDCRTWGQAGQEALDEIMSNYVMPLCEDVASPAQVNELEECATEIIMELIMHLSRTPEGRPLAMSIGDRDL